MAGQVWTADKIAELIDLLGGRPCLYNTKLKEYFDRDARRKAHEEIATALGVTGWYIMQALTHAHARTHNTDTIIVTCSFPLTII